MRTIFLIFSVLIACVPVFSQKNSENIIEHITASGNIVIQPDSIMKFLIWQEVDSVSQGKETQSPKKNLVGYRVQIFSDNNAKTAKNEARVKSRNVGNYFPEYRTYVTYNSPYWRVKVGDFKTQKEAEEAKEEISKAFPALRRELRIIRDRINPTAL